MELESLSIKIARSENLPVLPQVATAVLKLADDPNASARNLEKLIERDPALAAKTLRVANSSYYGLSNVATIARAISILGLNTIRSLVISVSYQQMISGRISAKNFDKVAFWSHSLAVATAARILGKMQRPEKAEELYIAGMMHDVGWLVLDRFYPGDLEEAIRIAKAETVTMCTAEERLLGFDHGVVGGLLAEKWGLPVPLQNAIKFHHNVDGDSEYSELTSIISMADYLAHSAGLGSCTPSEAVELDRSAQLMLDLPEQQLKVVGEVMLQEVQRAQAAFQVSLAA
ncbi:MAG: HDOD domain-containing protein [Methanoregulaceae archaeon]|nr:HDOD domain-containing protein [Methanoregulaceae archaeon]